MLTFNGLYIENKVWYILGRSSKDNFLLPPFLINNTSWLLKHICLVRHWAMRRVTNLLKSSRGIWGYCIISMLHLVVGAQVDLGQLRLTNVMRVVHQWGVAVQSLLWPFLGTFIKSWNQQHWWTSTSMGSSNSIVTLAFLRNFHKELKSTTLMDWESKLEHICWRMLRFLWKISTF